MEILSLLSILQMKCTDVHAVTSKHLYRLLHYSADSSSVYKCPTKVHYMSYSSSYTRCSQLLLVHRMVAYSNHSPAKNKMATRAMLIRDTFMLPMEPLTVIPYMEQGKEDSVHYHSNVLCSSNNTYIHAHMSLYCEINEDVRYTTT